MSTSLEVRRIVASFHDGPWRANFVDALRLLA
jgi:hypothetical protein